MKKSCAKSTLIKNKEKKRKRKKLKVIPQIVTPQTMANLHK
jgi:hypothetical protein